MTECSYVLCQILANIKEPILAGILEALIIGLATFGFFSLMEKIYK